MVELKHLACRHSIRFVVFRNSRLEARGKICYCGVSFLGPLFGRAFLGICVAGFAFIVPFDAAHELDFLSLAQ
jgi:hypothetical protein